MFIKEEKFLDLCFILLTVNLINFIHLINAQNIEEVEEDLNVELNSFNILPNNDKEWVDWNTIHLKKVGRNDYVIEGDIIVNRNLGNEQKIFVQIFPYDPEKKEKGKVVYIKEKDVCLLIKEDEDIYPQLLEVSNVPPKNTCPFPKGIYTINNYSLKVDFLPESTPKGDYWIELDIKDDQKIVAGVELHVTVS